MSNVLPKSPASNCQHGDQLPSQGTIGALFRDYGEQYIKTHKVEKRILNLIRSIRVCKTPGLGGKRYKCKDCGASRFHYFSCGNSQCPQCQGIKRLQWQDRLSRRMLKVPYVHTTFTLPHDLNGLARRNKKAIYGLMMRSSWQTINELCSDEKNVGAKPGMTAVLHTWGSDLKYHIHVHCLITFGGLDPQNPSKWYWPKRKHKLASFRKMCGLYRSIFLAELEKMMASKEVVYHRTFEEIKADMLKKRWVVNNTRPTAKTAVIEEYLSRYICRIGITNNRLSYDKNGKNVRIEYNDYRHQKQGQAAPKKYRDLDPLLAIHLILQHVLPLYFQKVRHYGLHAGATYNKIKDQIPDKLKRNGKTVRTIIEILMALLSTTPYKCEHCGCTEFITYKIDQDSEFIAKYLLMGKGRSPPFGLTNPIQQNSLSVINKPDRGMLLKTEIEQKRMETSSFLFTQGR